MPYSTSLYKRADNAAKAFVLILNDHLSIPVSSAGKPVSVLPEDAARPDEGNCRRNAYSTVNNGILIVTIM